MKVLATLALLGTLATVPAWAAPRVGAPAPSFSTVDAAGKTHALGDYRGKTVVLEWTNDQCPFVVKHYNSGNMQALQREAAAGGAVWLTVISSAPGKQGHVSGARARELTQARKAAPSAVLLDASGDIGRRYDAKTTPHLFVINPEGTLVYAGGIDSIPSADPADIARATPYLRLALAQTLAGEPVAQAVTQPYGCSIKY